ncbi:MAG: hypothetical protein A2275_11075 [Bacteroidetes bacterium RIFOXYA12_FULL_35_11]|nr:MAG: hypothetical protein A2X01_16115 [Bacteroidetes bacterium GWF2_35_48]OFY77355.1 MAG: hypothetical protein A2275_11075 [Bacteroidetes bacterium RIFOXYA12_FULL_35_11]OFY96198.1 MAG: hypothetical protein A2309_01035 [Bacteroidetes bacterium RIFOXYB2_FULL_35_7]OFZ02976.1 MAG: hypothetical protein A2491_17805 [Bacteroidetes bacterium RIFOXYC12_FULL_35_7]HBX50907.1 hypothetical protein [Bacteroidales bacterium]
METKCICEETSMFGWEKTNSTFSSEDVLNAYEKGVHKGKQLAIDDTKKFFTENLIKAQTLSSDFLSYIARLGINCKTAYLSIERIDKFKALFIVEKENYLQDEFKKIYCEAFGFRKMHNNNQFELRFSFMAESDDLNEEVIISDGYIFKHNEQKISL